MPEWTNDMMPGPGGMMGWGWTGMLLSFLLILALLAVLITGTIYLVRAMSRPQRGLRHDPSGQERSRQILDERYARGEIDEEEYESRRRTLGL